MLALKATMDKESPCDDTCPVGEKCKNLFVELNKIYGHMSLLDYLQSKEAGDKIKSYYASEGRLCPNPEILNPMTSSEANLFEDLFGASGLLKISLLE